MNTAIGSSDRQPSAEDAALARIVRREAGLIVAQLQRRLGNFDVAEEAVQEAILVALRTWRRDGVPAMQAHHGFPENFTPVELAFLDLRVNDVNTLQLESTFQRARTVVQERTLVTSGPIALDYLSGNAPARTDFNAVGLSPLPDGLAVCLRGGCWLASAPAAYFAAIRDEHAEAVAEPVGIAVGEVNFPLNPVQSEADSLRRVRAVDVVLQSCQNFGRHSVLLPECAECGDYGAIGSFAITGG